MKNIFRYNLKGKKFKHLDIEIGFNFYFCCSDFLKQDKGLKFIKKNHNISKFNWKKKTLENLDLISHTNKEEEVIIFIGHVNFDKKDHIFFLLNNDGGQWRQMPSLDFFKYLVDYKTKLNTFNCKSGKLSIFSDKFVLDNFEKSAARFYEINIKKGKYNLYSMNMNKAAKDKYPYDHIGALLVSN